MMFILGQPRSGTSWVSKIFDSSPDILLRYEPDISKRSYHISYLFNDDECSDASADDFYGYISSLFWVKTLRANGKTPFFRKNYRSAIKEYVRRIWIYFYKGLEKLIWKRFHSFFVPDLCSHKVDEAYLCLKSVSNMGRLNLFLRACPEKKFIVVVRHPCGEAESKIRGQKGGKLDQNNYINHFCRLDIVKEFDLDFQKLEKMNSFDLYMWISSLYLLKNLREIEGKENVYLLKYEDLCENPLDISKDMYHFTNLPWTHQTETFIKKSSQTQRGAFFSVYKDSKKMANAWKSKLSDSQKQSALKILTQTGLIDFYPL